MWNGVGNFSRSQRLRLMDLRFPRTGVLSKISDISHIEITDEVGEDKDHPLASSMNVLGLLVENYEDHSVPELA